MENNTDNPIEIIEASNELSLSRGSLSFLSEIARWTKFLSILMFIGIGFMVIIGFFAGSIFDKLGSVSQQPYNMPFPGFMLGFIYIIMALIYFPPVLYLFNFSTKIKKALANKDNRVLENAFENLKSHYKYIGIFTIVFMGIYLLFIFAVMIASAMF